MPVNPYGCCETVRDLCKSHSGRCSKVRHGGYTVLGRQLVQYCILKNELVLPSTCALPQDFNMEKQYPVCKYMNKYLTDFYSSARVLPEDISVEDTGRKCGRKKIFFFQVESKGKNPVKKRKLVPTTYQKNQDEEHEAEDTVSKKKTHKKNFFEDVLSGAKKYRRNYRELGNRQRVERVEQLAKDVMSACINQNAARQSGENFLKNNAELQMDVLTFLGKYLLLIF